MPSHTILRPLTGLLLLAAALAISAATGYWLAGHSAPASAEPQPLYWVNPMDPNDKRPGPAKDAMGMDFLPVYTEKQDGAPGIVTISPAIQQNMGVRLAEVTLAPWPQRIDTVGYVGYDEERLETVTARLSGWVRRLYVKSEGQPVRAGEPLFELYAPDLVNAQQEFLLAQGSGNPLLIKAAEGKLRALKVPEPQIAQIRDSRRVQETIRVPAPRSGYLMDLGVREGQYVEPATPLFSIADLAQVWVSAELFERQAAAVQVGMKATMTLDYAPDRHWQGRLDYIYPTLDATTRTLKLRLRFANPDGFLRPNMFAAIRLEQTRPPVLQVPAEAVIRTGHQDRLVLALGDGRFKSVAVQLGERSGERQAILAGVAAGDKVVSSAQFLIDSESSLNSDFQRMTAFRPVSVWSQGAVTTLDGRRVTITHQAVPEWQWPPMEMEFVLDDKLDAASLKVGGALHFEMRQQGDDYRITAIHMMGAAQGGQ